MLRVVMATLGVALIAFGLFGGKSLEQVHAGLNGFVERFSAGGEAQEILADATQSVQTSEQNTTQSSEQDIAESSEQDIAESSEQNIVQSSEHSIAKSSKQDTETSDQEVPAALAAEDGATPAVALDASASADSVVASAEPAGSTEPVIALASSLSGVDDDATMQAKSITESAEKQLDIAASVNDDSAMKEVKASARNSELELAQSVTASDLATGAGDSLLKDTAVGEILQTTTGQGSVETLFVLKDQVNLREGPSIEHSIVLRLEKGQELMEFKRDGKWVHVGAYGTSGKIGWVHQRLVGKSPG